MNHLFPKLARTLSISQLDEIDNILCSISNDSFVFISLHVCEEVDENYIKNCKILCSKLNDKNIKIIADVSRKTKEIFNLSLVEVADLLKLYALRIDYGVSNDEIKDISAKYKVAINASTITQEDLSEYISVTSNLIGIHNYYPRKETGLDFDYFDSQNRMLASFNIPVYAFIKGSKPYRLPVREGLPTLELNRDYLPHVSFIELCFISNLEGVIVGDPNLNEQENSLIKEFIDTGIIPIYADLKDESLYNKVFTCRIDSPSRLIRVKESREYSCFGKTIAPENCVERTYGTITIDNINYSRYSGEIMIVRDNLKKDDRINVIGKVLDCSLPLLKYIKGNSKFKFIR